MRLALISPKGVRMGDQTRQQRTLQIYQKLNSIESLKELMSCPNAPLLTIAAMATPYFEQIDYIDEEVEEINLTVKYDAVGMSFMTQQATRAYELGDIYRSRGVYTFAGGMHPTNLPSETLEHFDTVFIGECEDTWESFIQDFKQGCNKKIYKNHEVIDMDTVAMPRFDLLDIDRYRTIPIQISRGCPHNCTFCASTKVYGPKYRHKSVEKVLGEIREVKKYKENPQIYFTDDNMLVHKDFSKQLLTVLKDMNIRWMSHTDIQIADNEELLKLLYPSGCRRLVIGFESIEPKSLSNLEKWKYNKLKDYAKSIERIQSYGVGVWGTFIVGLDDDDKSIFQKVIDFTIENHLYGAMISVPTPFPGSQLYEELERDGRILTKCWADYTLWNVVIKPKNMTEKELEDGFAYTLESIYSKEAVINRMGYFKELLGGRKKA